MDGFFLRPCLWRGDDFGCWELRGSSVLSVTTSALCLSLRGAGQAFRGVSPSLLLIVPADPCQATLLLISTVPLHQSPLGGLASFWSLGSCT